MKLTYRTKVFKVLPYIREDKTKTWVLIFHENNPIYKDTLAFVSQDVYDLNTPQDKHSRWKPFNQKKL